MKPDSAKSQDQERPGRFAEPNAGRSAAARNVDRRLEQWMSRRSPRMNRIAVCVTAAVMIWLALGTGDMPNRASFLQGTALILVSIHGITHFLILGALSRFKARGSAAAEEALRAYFSRITHLDLALAWGVFALLAWL